MNWIPIGFMEGNLPARLGCDNGALMRPGRLDNVIMANWFCDVWLRRGTPWLNHRQAGPRIIWTEISFVLLTRGQHFLLRL